MEVTGVFLLSLILATVTAASTETGKKKRKTYNKLRRSFPRFLLLLWDLASSNVPTAAMEKEASIFLGIRPRFIAPPPSKGNGCAMLLQFPLIWENGNCHANGVFFFFSLGARCIMG